MSAPLSRRQKQVLDAIAAFIKGEGYCPSYDELRGLIGVSSLASVYVLLKQLERKGYIRRAYNSQRAIEILPKRVRGLNYCDEGHVLCYFSGDGCPACGMKGAA